LSDDRARALGGRNGRKIMIVMRSAFFPHAIVALFAAAVVAFPVTGAAADGRGNGPTVSDPWIRHAPPAARVHAGYMVFRNQGPAPVAVIGASSPAYERVEMHVSRTENGIAVMERMAQVDVPAGATARFEPGGLHLMLIRPKRVIALNDEVKIILILADGQEVAATAAVRKTGPDDQTPGHRDHHKGS